MTYDTPYCLTLDDDDLPSVRLIQAIASLTGAGRGELSPLHGAIDPEALNDFVRTDTQTSLSFEYEGFHVTVHADGMIVLRDPESIYTELTNPSNVLAVAPHADDGELCDDLHQPYPIDQENVLSVTADRSADEILTEWSHQRDTMPAEHKIISLGDFARSAGTKTVTLPGSIEADLIADERDLATLRERIDNVLSEWQSNTSVTILCFDSIDAILAATDLETTFRFFHRLTPRIADSDTIAHYHLDPLECDDRAVNALTPLFDTVIYDDGDATGSVLG